MKGCVQLSQGITINHEPCRSVRLHCSSIRSRRHHSTTCHILVFSASTCTDNVPCSHSRHLSCSWREPVSRPPGRIVISSTGSEPLWLRELISEHHPPTRTGVCSVTVTVHVTSKVCQSRRLLVWIVFFKPGLCELVPLTLGGLNRKKMFSCATLAVPFTKWLTVQNVSLKWPLRGFFSIRSNILFGCNCFVSVLIGT